MTATAVIDISVSEKFSNAPIKLKYLLYIMGNKKGIIWFLILYSNPEKTEVFKVINCQTIKEVAYYLNMKPARVSNFYHKLIKPAGVFKLIGLTQNYKI